MSEKPLVTAVLPTYNERDNIGPLIAGILADLSAVATEVVVVDDDSPDGTWQVVSEMGEADARVRLIRRVGERGLCSAIWAGIQVARGDIVVWMDCDLSMPTCVLPTLVGAIQEGADVALGSRYARGGRDVGHSAVAKAFSYTINLFASLLLGFQVRDYTSGFVAARCEVFERVPIRGDYGEYCIDFLHRARRMGYRLREIPYECVPRLAGDSKTATSVGGFLKRGRKYVTTILRLRFAADREKARGA